MIFIFIFIILVGLFFFLWIKYTRFYEKKIKEGEQTITITIKELREYLSNYHQLLKSDKNLAAQVKIHNQIKGKGEKHLPLKQIYHPRTDKVFDYIKVTKDNILIEGETQLNQLGLYQLQGKIKIKQINFTYNQYLVLVKKLMKVHYFIYKIFNKND
tara:strand:+ start:3905 stop:4375 length:471 start_codon:yes stop_codon:yes gene_type:complete